MAMSHNFVQSRRLFTKFPSDVYAPGLSYDQLVAMATDERGAEFHMD
jgi:hypothetical protein